HHAARVFDLGGPRRVGHRILRQFFVAALGFARTLMFPISARAAQPAMYPFHHTLWNSHRDVAPLEPTFGLPPLDYTGLTRKHSPNRLLARAPETSQFTDGKMTLRRRFPGLTRDTARPLDCSDGRFSCLHGAPPCLKRNMDCPQYRSVGNEDSSSKIA